jgi:hypothetical protein
VASRDPQGSFSAPERAATDFTVTGTALGRGGEVLLTDVRSRVVTRPPGGAFSSPVTLPAAADTPYGPGALVAANGAGDAVALYRGDSPVLASRRTPGWCVAPADRADDRERRLRAGGRGRGRRHCGRDVRAD